jgi:hypothetical protein
MSGLAITATSKSGGEEWDNYTNTLGNAAAAVITDASYTTDGSKKTHEEEE